MWFKEQSLFFSNAYNFIQAHSKKFLYTDFNKKVIKFKVTKKNLSLIYFLIHTTFNTRIKTFIIIFYFQVVIKLKSHVEMEKYVLAFG